MRTLLAILALAMSQAAHAAGPAALFASDEPIEVTIKGPISTIVRNAAKSTEPAPGEIIVGADAEPITLAARGNARRQPEACKFPPLRIRFPSKPGDQSIFHKQKSLKLVTHCRPQSSFEKHTLLEYAAYRMYNELTDASLKVRLARIRYVDENSKEYAADKLGFFIEDIDDLADRVDMKEVNASGVELSQYDGPSAARVKLFFHMIANHDWSMRAGPDGECCHNGKLLGRTETATEGLVFVPYDFDYSGFVDAPYALPPESIRIRSVRTRYYRGGCAQNEDMPAAAALFRARRPAMEAAVRETPFMNPKVAAKAIKYLAPFFDEIADDAAVAKLVERCR